MKLNQFILLFKSMLLLFFLFPIKAEYENLAIPVTQSMNRFEIENVLGPCGFCIAHTLNFSALHKPLDVCICGYHLPQKCAGQLMVVTFFQDTAQLATTVFYPHKARQTTLKKILATKNYKKLNFAAGTCYFNEKTEECFLTDTKPSLQLPAEDFSSYLQKEQFFNNELIQYITTHVASLTKNNKSGLFPVTYINLKLIAAISKNPK